MASSTGQSFYAGPTEMEVGLVMLIYCLLFFFVWVIIDPGVTW